MPADRPPNILWICTDQQRADTVSALGNPHIRTPHVDRLVREGVSFLSAYAQSPVCTPSRAAMLTGRYPRTTRCRQNGQRIPADERLVTRLLADAGYDCGLAGKLHLSSCANGRVEQRTDDGYRVFHWSHHPQPDWPENAYTQWLHRQGTSWEELYRGPDNGFVKHGVPACYHQTTWCAEMAIEFIREHADGDQPWLFSFNCFDPHHPFDPPPEYLQRYDPAQMPLPRRHPGELHRKPIYQRLDAEWAHNNPGEFHTGAMTDQDRRQVTAAYYAMIELIDDQVGRMLGALEETGQLENTVVIFMSDHGELLGDHGLYFKGPHFYDVSIRVPLIVRLPKGLCDVRRHALVELIDLAPTLLELAGLSPHPGIQGRSLVPLLTRDDVPDALREDVYCEYYNAWTHPRAYATMLRTTEHKVVVYHSLTGQDVDGELYDLQADPHEFENLWNDPRYRSLQDRLVRRCFDRSVFTMDPLPPRLGPF